jgi:hypothetical protein
VLASPLGNTLGWLGSREYYDDWDGEPFWSSIGYASDMGGMDRPVFQDEIKLEEEDGGDMMAMTSTTGDFVDAVRQRGVQLVGRRPVRDRR